MRSPRNRARRSLRTQLRVACVLASALCGALGASASSTLPAEPLLLPSLPETARAEAVLEGETPQLIARLLSEGDPVERVGVLFDLAPGWHLYWRNPGGTGLAPEVDLQGPGMTFGALQWPTPETFREADGLFTTYGYEGSVMLTAAVERAEPDAESTGMLRADVSVLICRTECVPASFELALPIDSGLSRAEQTAIRTRFEFAATRVPPTADALGIQATASWTGEAPAADAAGRVALQVRACPETEPSCDVLSDAKTESLFLPLSQETFELGSTRLVGNQHAPGHFELEMDLTRLEPGQDRLQGLLSTRTRLGNVRLVEIDVPIAAAALPAQAAVAATATPLPWLRIVLLALLGGLILNGMPCVLPVLAIKVVSIADMAEKDPHEVRMHGLAYTAGVLGSMGALAALVIALRSAGHSVGWGFQFQEPLFVAGISAVLVAFALNLFGVFEIELGQGKLASIGQESTGVSRSLFEGLLAVVLATPCTAPFLGTAVGFAFATSGFGIAGIFLAIGLGLASPFLVVSFVPRLARFIPRSGPWMLKFRVILGFCLLSTVLWLLWVLGQSGGLGAVIGMTGNLLLLAFLLWGFGQLQPLRSAWLGRLGAAAIAGIAIVSFNLIDFDRAAAETQASQTLAAESGWQPYSEQAVADAVAGGQTAFVVFTADWCITCKVNESSVIERAAVQEGFARQDVALFKADWTRRDEGIRQKLAEFGRAGVPLYLVYSPGAPDEPRVLSELLSQQEVLGALAEAARPARG